MAERCLVAASATGLFKHPKIETSGFATWTEDHIAAYRLRWPLGTMERLAIEIGLNHGPRRGDAVLHGPRQEIDGGLGYVQGKTRAEMFNTIWPPLRAAIDAMPVRGLDTYLVTSFGKPFTAAGFGNWFRDACDAVPGLPRALSFHGLRKAVCRRVAEAKGDARSTKHVQAVSGHTTLKMVERYTEAASRKRLQREAGQAVYETFDEQPRTSDLHTPGQVSHTRPGRLANKGE
jgi:integrase